VVGVVGSPNTGKTTYLAALYLLLNRGKQLADYAFAGSFTLGGWENIARHMRLDGRLSPSFPPHTASNVRLPGLLHLALRRDSRLIDCLFADAPGEWFDTWATERDAVEAEGARWVARNSDAFLLFVDCDALSGEPAKRGGAKARLEDLAARLAGEAGARPVLVVWAKADRKGGQPIFADLEQDLAERHGFRRSLEISVVNPSPGRGVLELTRALLEPNPAVAVPAWSDPVADPSPFLAFRGRP
jgi:hypothetical protein